MGLDEGCRVATRLFHSTFATVSEILLFLVFVIYQILHLYILGYNMGLDEGCHVEKKFFHATFATVSLVLFTRLHLYCMHL